MAAFTFINTNAIVITIIFSYFVTVNSFIMNLMLIFQATTVMRHELLLT